MKAKLIVFGRILKTAKHTYELLPTKDGENVDTGSNKHHLWVDGKFAETLKSEFEFWGKTYKPTGEYITDPYPGQRLDEQPTLWKQQAPEWEDRPIPLTFDWEDKDEHLNLKEIEAITNAVDELNIRLNTLLPVKKMGEHPVFLHWCYCTGYRNCCANHWYFQVWGEADGTWNGDRNRKEPRRSVFVFKGMVDSLRDAYAKDEDLIKLGEYIKNSV